ncbi:MAG: LamB/YcsF family protein [Salinibacterium sp.]|nr:LamB/YcsF family protein [Salinibacterium sp.]
MNWTRPVSIDLNADFGEGASSGGRTEDEAVLEFVTSVNIACGGHAGDQGSMRTAVRAAARFGVAVGAHPSYPDRANFGRARVDLEPDALKSVVSGQIAALMTIADSEGLEVRHCKPHGALYHAACNDESVAQCIFEACRSADPRMRIVGLAGSRALDWWRALGATVVCEAFADRVYEPDGSLRPRGQPSSVIADPEAAAAQAVMIAADGHVRCSDGSLLPLAADTLCIHTDTAGASAIAASIAAALRSSGVELKALRSQWSV